MNSTLDTATASPDAVLAARADERLTHAYEQIALADEQLARVTEKLSNMERDSQRRPAAVSVPRSSRDRPALRGLLALILAGGIGAAAYAAQTPYGEAARSTIARWAPQFVTISPPPSAKPATSAPGPSGVQLAAVEAASVQPATQDVAPTPAPISSELAQTLQTMTHDIATLEQGVEQLKASQERMAVDNARAIEQLKASQEQMARLVVPRSGDKPSETDPRAKKPAPAAPKVASAKPKSPQDKLPQDRSLQDKPPPKQPSQARAQSQPIQLQPKQQ
jgi:hypothetical protein